ncbi:uncharacterized protein LOC131056339 [Cryptomeria japonica]|uniref:uncharacterized protein LOC131056339 n=1 Tax=Cryptomeria japonica TaxID=3369 RepID=UPI0027DA9C6E|nr:uncharacterized protein LOC131056339 [Cryptomeria japonica]
MQNQIEEKSEEVKVDDIDPKSNILFTMNIDTQDINIVLDKEIAEEKKFESVNVEKFESPVKDAFAVGKSEWQNMKDGWQNVKDEWRILKVSVVAHSEGLNAKAFHGGMEESLDQTHLNKKAESIEAKDLGELQAEFLKWGMKVLAPHIAKIFNNIIPHGFPKDWTTSLAIPLFKSGDVNNPSNDRTIMINPLFAKLFGSMIENRIRKWAEENHKCAKGQAGFRPKHSTVDHGITLRHIIEKTWEKKEDVFCCFVDFKKAFDIVPRDKLWHKMEELGIPAHLRAAVHRLYEEVKVKIRTPDGMMAFQLVLGVILVSNKGVLFHLPCLAYTLTNLKNG